MNQFQKAHRSLERAPIYREQDLDEGAVKRFLYALYAYIAILICLTAFFIFDASAQEIGELAPDDSIKTELAPKIEGFISQLDQIDHPNMPSYIDPSDPISDLSQFASGPNKDLFIYGMMTAMVEKADRENYYCQIDLDAGYNPCRFGSIKPRDFHAKKWLEDYNALQVKSRSNLANLARASLNCIGGFEVYPDSGICSKYPDWITAEQHGYHKDLHIHQLSLRNQELEAKCGYGAPTAKICIDQGSIKDGSGGFLWKAEGDPKARCANGTTILLSKEFDSITEIELLDVNQNVIFKPSYFGKLSDGRPRFCAFKRLGSSFTGPLLVKYGQNCKTVTNPSVRED